MSKSAVCWLGIAVCLLWVSSGADWTQFRGPGGSGVSEDTALPTTWSATENVVWKTSMPGFGASSPITLGEKIFLTAYSGYGLDKANPGEQESLLQHVICVDRATGKILWDRRSRALLDEESYGGMIALHGYASGTPATDGEAVFAFFGRSGVYAYSLDGELLWKKNVGGGTHKWGSGTSPILHENLLIVNASVESGSVVGLDKKTGEVVWRAEDVLRSWSTPGIVTLPDGKQELVVSMENKVRGYDPGTGKQLWECASVQDYVCPLVVVDGDKVYVTGGRTPLTIAIRAGGRGDVTHTHLLWDVRKCSKVPSPVYHDGRLYWIDNKGMACCIDAETGDVLHKPERLDISGSGSDKLYASLVLAHGKLYCVTRSGGTIVLTADAEMKELARNDLGDESIFNATPVVSNGQLLLRSDRFLYCIGK